MNVGKRIREIRLANGLSQSVLSKNLNISSSTLSRYESGFRPPSFDFLYQFSVYFSIHLSSLIGPENTTGTSESDDVYSHFNTTILTAAQWSMLNEEAVEKIRSYAKYVYEESLKKQIADKK